MKIPEILLEAHGLQINFLVIEDRCVLEYVGSFEPATRVDAVKNCLELGARALSYAADQSGTTLLSDALKQSTESHKSLLETVAKQTRATVIQSAEELPKKLHTILKVVEKDLAKTLNHKDASGIIGGLTEYLAAGVAKEASKLTDALDWQNPKSPLSQLNAQMEKRDAKFDNQLQKIAAELQARAAANAIWRKTTGKGVSFEDTLETYIANESRPRHDLVVRTSKTTGIEGNDKGDITIEIEKNHAHGPGLHVVIEAKNAQTSFPALVRDVEKAMTNRGAVFGIGVSTNVDITRGSSLIVPIGDDKLIVCAPQVGEDEFELLGVAVALEMARWKAILSRVTPTDQMDLNRINAHVTAAFSIVKRFSEAKRKMTSVKTAVDDAWTYVDAIRSDLQVELRNLRTALAEELAGDVLSGDDAAAA